MKSSAMIDQTRPDQTNLFCFKSWRGIALISYLWLVLLAWVIVYVDVSSVETRRRFYIITVAEVILFALIYICPKLLNWADLQNIIPDPETLTPKDKKKFFSRTWLAISGVFMMLYLIFYPGGYGADAISMFSQALGKSRYVDWHPVFNTWFSYTLPLRLTGNWLGAPMLFQYICLSSTMAYMICTLLEYSSKKYTKYFTIYLMLNPAVLLMPLYTPKDSTFAMTMLLLMTFAVRIYYTKGEWLKSMMHFLMFMIALVSGTLFRHNAVLFTLPLLFAASIFAGKKRAVIMFVLFIGSIVVIRGPVYDALNVQRPGGRKLETLGLPMSIIANSVKEAHEKLDAEVLDFAYSVAPQDVYDEKYNTVNGFNTIRTASSIKARNAEESERLRRVINANAVEEAGTVKVITLALRCFKEAPFAALRGFCGVTSLVYGIAGIPMGRVKLVIEKNDLGLVNNNFLNLSFVYRILESVLSLSSARDANIGANDFLFGTSDNVGGFSLQSLIILWSYVMMVLGKHLFWCIGVLNLVIIIFVLAKLRLNRLDDWVRLCFVLPVFAYNYGTMFFLQANDYRFFYYTYLVMPLVLIVLFRNNSEVQS